MGKKRNIVSHFGNDIADFQKKHHKEKTQKFTSFPTLSVLMFHHVDQKIPSEPWKKNLSVTPEKLEEIIEIFGEKYTFVTLSEAKAVFDGKKTLKNPHMVCLTFDDGYKDFLEYALPILKKHDIKANLSVVGKFIEDGLEEFLTWKELKIIQETKLVEIDSHTYNLHQKKHDHPIVLFTKWKDLIADADKNDSLIKDHLGEKPKNLIMPYGTTILGLGKILNNRYDFIAITSSGTNTKYSNHNFLHRFAVLESEPAEQLLSIVDGYLGLEFAKYGIIYS